ncbi:MAG: cytochrome ubiquinol oxidase subunit I [Candidatus Omnitrophica bacterium]|nr:cytochrome ubiquinol oxidase subunit I [Candidatus Omnitrophota bacterium]
MNYPLWDVPMIGGGWVIGITAIFHLLISQFAVGGGLYLALAEQKALREGRRDWLEVIRLHSRFFLILTAVFGTVSGVGIWFAIGLANPEGTSALIHNFVFAWAIEWVFFLVELATVAVYYYTWGRISDRLHLQVGWLYAVASFFTLFIINGILSFKLTPGSEWLAVAGSGQEASRFWEAMFNPGFWPSLFLRMGICSSLAGVWALATCSRISNDKPKLKEEFIQWTAKWLLPLFMTMPFLLAWYVHQIPEAQRVLFTLGVNTVAPGVFTMVTRMVVIILVSSITIMGVVYFIALRSPSDFKIPQAVVIVFLALTLVGSLEYTREMLRKPFIIAEHLYSNGVRTKAIERVNKDGYLKDTLWIRGGSKTSVARGEAMYRGQCMSCHTVDGYRPTRTLLAGRDRAAIGSFLKVLHEHKPDSPYYRFMPPLVGTDDEVQALGDYLETLVPKTENSFK